ncbi:hypothetical protein ACS0TY_005468 [Phlomoides rotata]
MASQPGCERGGNGERKFLYGGATGAGQPTGFVCEAGSVQDFVFLRESFSDAKVADPESGKCYIDAFSIINAMKNYNDGLGEESRKFLRKFREKLDANLVVDVLRNVQIPELGLKFFMWAGAWKANRYSHSMVVYDALLELLGGGKNDKVNDSFLSLIKKDDSEVLGRLLNVLIRKCYRNGMWNLALEKLGRLKDLGYKPSRVTYNALIQVFLEAYKLDIALLLHREMINLGFKMDMHILGCFVHFLCKVGKWRDALNMIEKEGVKPDTFMYTKMIIGLCEASLFEEAMEFLNRMRVDSCYPNVVMYRILLCGCLNKGKLGRCKRILSMMIAKGCYPSLKIFCSLVHAYYKSGDHSYASICGNEEFSSQDMLELDEKAYDEMLDVGIALNRVNVGNFTRCLCGAEKYDKAYNIIREMTGNGFIPEAVGLIQQARCWFDEIMRYGCTPNVVTYTAIIHAYLKARKISDANEVFKMMLAQGCPPNVVMFTALIDGYNKAGNIEKACMIYEKMRENVDVHDVDIYFRICDDGNKEPNVVTYGALADGLCKVHRVKEARNLLDAMSSSGCEPNHIVYDALIDGFCKVGKLDEAHEVFAKMSECGYIPNVYTYNSLIDRLFKDKRLDLALKVLAKMLENSCAPNVIIYTEMVEFIPNK